MASYSFFPQGTQLDNDETPDIQTEVGDRITVDSILDVSGDVTGNDETNLSEPANQAIDLQPSPTVQTILGTEKSDSIFGTPQNSSPGDDNTAAPIVEADGWKVNRQGKIVLVAASNDSQTSSIAQPPANCSAN